MAATLQTLDRGLNTLKLIAGTRGGLTMAALAERLQVDRAIAYRLVNTLESHGFVNRDTAGRLFLGAGVSVLAAGYEPHLKEIVQPRLQDLAEEVQATAFLSAAQGDQCVALMVAEPDAGLLRVGYRVGSAHAIDRGAAGIAILAGRTEQPLDSDEVRQARIDGYSLTRGQLQKGAVGVASPVPTSGQGALEASIGVVALEDLDVARAIPAVRRCADGLRPLLEGRA